MTPVLWLLVLDTILEESWQNGRWQHRKVRLGPARQCWLPGDKANLIPSFDQANSRADWGTTVDRICLGFSGESDNSPPDNFKLMMQRHVGSVLGYETGEPGCHHRQIPRGRVLSSVLLLDEWILLYCRLPNKNKYSYGNPFPDFPIYLLRQESSQQSKNVRIFYFQETSFLYWFCVCIHMSPYVPWCTCEGQRKSLLSFLLVGP